MKYQHETKEKRSKYLNLDEMKQIEFRKCL